MGGVKIRIHALKCHACTKKDMLVQMSKVQTNIYINR